MITKLILTALTLLIAGKALYWTWFVFGVEKEIAINHHSKVVDAQLEPNEIKIVLGNGGYIIYPSIQQAIKGLDSIKGELKITKELEDER